jgi:hypothetical protein
MICFVGVSMWYIVEPSGDQPSPLLIVSPVSTGTSRSAPGSSRNRSATPGEPS